ncbi:hypothetical protein [Bradyrhizobium liaoningense]|uniref:hypothetical protein n=1 Tax=Bradyrhizobium liaoningense TaxID=43992 RepID=UPI002012566F|nr:hypothetical protein [Bradyrhizobium liaoningense]
MSTYVLIHAAWHTGEHYWPTASLLRAAGHHVFTPTMSGNRLGDQKTTGLAESIESVVEFISEKNLDEAIAMAASSSQALQTVLHIACADLFISVHLSPMTANL